MIKRPEVLSPCGNEESFEAALASGADAVYLAGNAFGARAYAGNFDFQDLPRIIRRAHLFGVKVYLTLNTLMKEEEFEGLAALIRPLSEAGLDACLVQDPGLFMWLRENFPALPLHASTQMNITGPAGACLLRDMGATRIVAAREMSLSEIVRMKEASGLETEVFVHGAMCVCYSGRCLLSSAAGERSGNRGRCAQPCRKMYGKSYPLSMKDLSALPFVPALVEAGIDSLKIEGRMKQPVYTATVTEVYREAVEAVLAGAFSEDKVKKWEERLSDAFSRGEFGRGYLFGGKELLTGSTSGRTGVVAGRIAGIKGGKLEIRAERHITPGDELHPAGRPEIRLTSNMDIPEGKTGELAAPKTGELRKGMEIIRTRSGALEQHLAELLEKGPKRGFSAVFTARAGQPISLRLTADATGGEENRISVTVYGEASLPAEKRSASVDEVKEKLLATGNTEFVCRSLSVEMDEGQFLRASALKQLRRDGLQALEEAIIASGERESAETDWNESQSEINNGTDVIETTERKEFYFTASAPAQAAYILQHAKEYFAENRAFESGTSNGSSDSELNHRAFDMWLILDGGYGDFSPEEMQAILEKGRKSGWKMAIGLPHVSRMPDFAVRDNLLKLAEHPQLHTEQKPKSYPETKQEDSDCPADGLYIRCMEDLAEVYIRFKNGTTILPQTLILASSLYAVNHRAGAFYQNLFPGKNVILEGNTELTGQELRGLMSTNKSIVPRCYGREELMLTSATSYSGKFRDDSAHEFFMYSPAGLCYNVLLNGVPLSLHREDVTGGFFHFTTEEPQEIRRVFDAFTRKEKEADYPCTRGHWGRGVL